MAKNCLLTEIFLPKVFLVHYCCVIILSDLPGLSIDKMKISVKVFFFSNISDFSVDPEQEKKVNVDVGVHCIDN